MNDNSHYYYFYLVIKAKFFLPDIFLCQETSLGLADLSCPAHACSEVCVVSRASFFEGAKKVLIPLSSWGGF